MTAYRSNRKTTPKVRDGRVQKKNRLQPTRFNSLKIVMRKPGRDACHVVSPKDLWRFVNLLPDWKRVSADLDLIFLCRGVHDADGWYEYPAHPSIALSAWNDDLILHADRGYMELHRPLFVRLGVDIVEESYGGRHCQFTEDSARAFQLLHIFLHELGHHHFRITEGRGKSAGSEKYAEDYALKWEKRIWHRYCEEFHFKPKPMA